MPCPPPCVQYCCDTKKKTCTWAVRMLCAPGSKPGVFLNQSRHQDECRSHLSPSLPSDLVSGPIIRVRSEEEIFASPDVRNLYEALADGQTQARAPPLCWSRVVRSLCPVQELLENHFFRKWLTPFGVVGRANIQCLPAPRQDLAQGATTDFLKSSERGYDDAKCHGFRCRDADRTGCLWATVCYRDDVAFVPLFNYHSSGCTSHVNVPPRQQETARPQPKGCLPQSQSNRQQLQRPIGSRLPTRPLRYVQATQQHKRKHRHQGPKPQLSLIGLPGTSISTSNAVEPTQQPGKALPPWRQVPFPDTNSDEQAGAADGQRNPQKSQHQQPLLPSPDPPAAKRPRHSADKSDVVPSGTQDAASNSHEGAQAGTQRTGSAMPHLQPEPGASGELNKAVSEEDDEVEIFLYGAPSAQGSQASPAWKSEEESAKKESNAPDSTSTQKQPTPASSPQAQFEEKSAVPTLGGHVKPLDAPTSPAMLSPLPAETQTTTPMAQPKWAHANLHGAQQTQELAAGIKTEMGATVASSLASGPNAIQPYRMLLDAKALFTGIRHYIRSTRTASFPASEADLATLEDDLRELIASLLAARPLWLQQQAPEGQPMSYARALPSEDGDQGPFRGCCRHCEALGQGPAAGSPHHAPMCAMYAWLLDAAAFELALTALKATVVQAGLRVVLDLRPIAAATGQGFTGRFEGFEVGALGTSRETQRWVARPLSKFSRGRQTVCFFQLELEPARGGDTKLQDEPANVRWI